MVNKIGSIYKRRERIHLLEHEIAQVIEICRESRQPIRNELLILMTYNHALRASETCNLKWTDINFYNKSIAIRRMKGGRSGMHPIESTREYELLMMHYEKRDIKCPYIFMSRTLTTPIRFTRYSPTNFNEFCHRLGLSAGFEFKFTPHMLRHAKTTFLCEEDVSLMTIRDFVGHARISSTERYIHLAANKYKGINKGSIFA